MKKKVILISLVALIVIGVIVAVAVINNSGKETLVEDPNVKSDYDYQLYYEKSGTIRLELEKGKIKDGTWSCDKGESNFVDVDCKKGTKDVFSLKPDKTGTMDLGFVLNDGEKDIYKIVFTYSSYNGNQSLTFKYATECAAVNSFGSKNTALITCDTSNPSLLALNIVSDDGSWNSEYDSDVVSLLYDYSASDKAVLKVSAVSKNCDTDVTLTGSQYKIIMKLHIDENMFVSLVSGKVEKIEVAETTKTANNTTTTKSAKSTETTKNTTTAKTTKVATTEK